MGGLFKEAVDVSGTVEWKAGRMSVTHREHWDQSGGCADDTLRKGMFPASRVRLLVAVQWGSIIRGRA